MNINIQKAILASGIEKEILDALAVIVASRAAVTPAVLIPFVGYAEPNAGATDTQRNTAILAMLANLTLVAGGPVGGPKQ